MIMIMIKIKKGRLRARVQPPTSKQLQRLQHRLYPRHFVGAEQVGLPHSRQHGEERFRRADLFAKAFEGMGQRMANRKAERAQPKGVEESGHLMTHSHRTV